MLLVIIIFSSMNNDDSNSKSRFIIKNSVVFVNNVFSLDMDNSEINDLVIKLNYPFRKTCHFLEYFVLSLLIVMSLRLANFNIVKTIITTIIFCLFFSISDEVHQMFVSGRSPLVLDCIIDTSGSCLFCFIYYFKTKKLS